jgi:cell division septation protein DedD
MNEVLQRRLTGALVLFLLAFVLASLLPDVRTTGRSGNTQVVTYDLGTGLQLDESPPAPVEEEVPENPPAPPPSRTAVQLQESPALSSVETWFVQVGSFEDEANARRVLVKLKQLRMPTSIQSVQVGKGLWYRVRVGPYPAEAHAQEALGTIRRQGYSGAKLVRPESR